MFPIIDKCSDNISHEQILKDKIHEIHNFLKNNRAGYGMDALKVFIVIYGLKKIEDLGLLDNLDIARPQCEFSYILEMANNDGKHEELAELIYINILDSLAENKQGLRDILFFEIPKTLRGAVLAKFVKKINEITIIEKTFDVSLTGKIYEYFIGRDETAINELGIYFTDRKLVNYILDKLNPTINQDNTISTMIDIFGGSGGFTNGYVNYLNNKYHQLINWNNEINKINQFDLNSDLNRIAGFELLCSTGVLPNMDKLKCLNSFNIKLFRKYKYILTNPPYIENKNIINHTYDDIYILKDAIEKELTIITDQNLLIKRQKQLKEIYEDEKQEKIKMTKLKENDFDFAVDFRWEIQNFAKKYDLDAYDRETCSLILMMNMLESEGTAIGIFKEEVFFAEKYKNLRKCLIENYNVKEIINIPQNKFENILTKSSIIIFDNCDKKTSQVKFTNIVVKRYNENKFAEYLNKVAIIEKRGTIMSVEDITTCIASIDQILENSNYSLISNYAIL